LDVAKIVDVFGLGPTGCAHALQSVGFQIERAAISRWVERGRIPMNGWLMIDAAHEIRTGKPLNLNDFMVQK
jgi:hypothetical protein